jgi:mRNA interferase YafQ
MLDIRYSTKFKKDYKTIMKRGYNPKLLETVLNLLCTKQALPPKYRDHPLSGNYEGHRECHITPDWLLISKIEQNILTLTLTRTGTHSDLF